MLRGRDRIIVRTQLNSARLPKALVGQGTSWVAVSPATPGERVERALAKHSEAPVPVSLSRIN